MIGSKGIFGGLRDNRTEEEMLRDFQQFAGAPAQPSGLGMFGASARLAAPPQTLPALTDNQAGGPGPDLPAASAPNQPPALEGNWSNFDPSVAADQPMATRFGNANAILQGQSPKAADAKAARAPWEISRGRNFWGTLLETVGTSLMAQQAFANGDYGSGSTMLRQMQQDQEERRRRQQLGLALRGRGYSDDDIMIAMNDPQSLSRNYNERFGTRVVAPGSSIVQGGPGGQQQTYTQPGQAEQYASALGYRPGTPDYQTAAQDYVLRSSGPTAYGYDVGLDDQRTANDISLERARQTGRSALETQRQQGRLGLEGTRQQNRITTRGTPTYRDLNPPAPRTSRQATGGPAVTAPAAQGPTATGPNGQKLRWNGSSWVPIR